MSDSTIENQNATQNPATEKPGTNFDTSIINKAFIKSEKIPKVSIFIGKVSIFIIGLINMLIKVSTMTSTKALIQVTCTPGTK